MPVMDEFREERAAIKQGTFKQKYQYFKDYYRTTVIIVVLALAFVGILLYHYVTRKDSACYAVMLNCAPYQENEWFEEEYAQAAGIDLDKYDVTFDTAIYYKLNSTDEDTLITTEKLDVYTAAGELDVMLGAGDEFAHFANSVLFKDLREVLNDEQIAKYEPYFYYVDSAAIGLVDYSVDNRQDLDKDQLVDPKHPEDMKEPIPVAIYVEGSDALNEAYYFKNADDGIALGIYANTSNTENAISLIEYLMNQ